MYSYGAVLNNTSSLLLFVVKTTLCARDFYIYFPTVLFLAQVNQNFELAAKYYQEVLFPCS